MFPFTIHNQPELNEFLAIAITAYKESELSELMPFTEIIEKRRICNETLTAWIKSTGIKTYKFGRGKAIKRTDYRKLP